MLMVVNITNVSRLTIPINGSYDNDWYTGGDNYQYQQYKYYFNWFLYDPTYQVLMRYVFHTFSPLALSMFGIGSNIINIVIFYRQGFLIDSSTASLVGLTISDFLSCVIKFIQTVLRLPFNLVYFLRVNDYIDPIYVLLDLIALLTNCAHLILINVTCWITCFIALERLISVTLPFHVKRMFTPKRTYVFILCFLVISFGLYMPYSLTWDVGIVKIVNQSVRYELRFTELIPARVAVDAHYVVDIYMREFCIGIVVAFNIAIIAKVNLSKRFRKKTSTTKSATTISGSNINNSKHEKGFKKDGKIPKQSDKWKKEGKLTRMMVILCFMFAFCFIPQIVIYSLIPYWSVVPPIMLYILDAITLNVETINPSFNLIIYYTMSSKFKKEFNRLFSCNKG